MSEAGMWAIFVGDNPLKLMIATEDEVRFEAQVQTNWHENVSMHQLVTITEHQSARREAIEEAAKVAENWKCSLEPGNQDRLLGHQEAAGDIATAIRQLSQEGPQR